MQRVPPKREEGDNCIDAVHDQHKGSGPYGAELWLLNTKCREERKLIAKPAIEP